MTSIIIIVVLLVGVGILAYTLGWHKYLVKDLTTLEKDAREDAEIPTRPNVDKPFGRMRD